MSNQFKVTADGFAMVMNSAEKMTAGITQPAAASISFDPTNAPK